MTKKKQSKQIYAGILGDSARELKAYEGKGVIIKYDWHGTRQTNMGILNSVEGNYVTCDNWYIPFFGFSSLIRKITEGNGNVLYENKFVPKNYNPRDKKERKALAELCFGEEFANKVMK